MDNINEKNEENYLVFVVDERKFALSFSDVEIIVTGRKPTPAPDFPDYVMGTIVEMDSTVTVLNLRKRFGYEEKELSERDCIIITPDTPKLGILCDKAEGFITVKNNKIFMPPDTKYEPAARFIKGQVINDSGDIIYILTPKLIVKPEDEDKILS